MSRNLNPRKNTPREEWLDSLVAPFIRRILKATTDADRTAVARELADWLAAHGDCGTPSGDAFWLRHPALRWEVRGGGRAVSWRVDPWDNSGHGKSARIDIFWWVTDYPTPEWLAGPRAEHWVRVWMGNGVGLSHPWELAVADRIGIGPEARQILADRAERAERARKHAEEEELRDAREYARLWAKFGGVRPDAVAAPANRTAGK